MANIVIKTYCGFSDENKDEKVYAFVPFQNTQNSR